jgi:hypothetical protein
MTEKKNTVEPADLFLSNESNISDRDQYRVMRGYQSDPDLDSDEDRDKLDIQSEKEIPIVLPSRNLPLLRDPLAIFT